MFEAQGQAHQFEDSSVLGVQPFDDDGDDDDLMGVLDGVQALLDDAETLPLALRLKFTKELLQLRAELGNSPGIVGRLKIVRRMLEIRQTLGAGAKPGQAEASPQAQQPEAVAGGVQPRKATGQFYEFDPNRKQAQRKRDNSEAMALLRQIDAGEVDGQALTDAQRLVLAKYSGTGGALVGADGKKGSAYEYYTPKPIAEGVWNVLREMGFSGGLGLDPCGGVGIFGATAPLNAAVDAVELNATSGRINQLVNDGPGYSTTIAPFEQVAAATPDETYDVVVSNVPFGELADRGGNQFKDPRYQKEPIQNYFILRSLEKLRPGGLAAFITPPRCVSGKGGKEEDLRVRVSYMAEFMGAYRLPNSVFGTAAADTMTDVIFFRKYSREVLDRIEELREQNPALLASANVLWAEFISGMYFAGEGKRYILGTTAKAKGRFGEVDVLNSDLSMADIAKLLVKFPGSRVNWDALAAAETAPIVYRDGDTIYHAGQTLQQQDGRWVAIGSAAGSEEAQAAMAESLARVSTPLGAVTSGTTFEQAQQLRDAMVNTGRALEVPDWLRGLLHELLKLDAGRRSSAWNAAIVGLAVDQAILERQSEETGFNYAEGYAVLSDAMKRVASDAKNPPAQLSGAIKTAMKKVAIHYTKAQGFSAFWRGDVAEARDDRNDAQKFEAARYQAGGGAFVPIEQARSLFGDDFDPIGDDGWCVSADGMQVAKADDYFVGNYGDFLARIDADLAAATDETTRAKLLRQKLNAEQRLVRNDPATMSFTLFSPFVLMEERAEFLRRFVDPRFVVAFDEKDGRPYIECDIGTPKNEQERNLKRFAEYMRTGTVSTRTSAEDKADNPKLEVARIAALRSLVETSGAQFNSWVKSNPAIMGRLHDVANDPQRLYFRQVEDESPLDIPGISPEWAAKVSGYQNAWIRRTSRDFSGINAFGVGLGKTSSALLAVQYAQSIGTKRRTMFPVPNSVLSNWRKEAGRVFANTDDCLFVGLTENGGSFTVNPSNYDRDLNRILEGRHSKIFVTMEAFQRLRLKPATAEAYDAHLARVDASYAASDDKKTDEKKKGLRAALIDQLTGDKSKSAAAPFFEDLGIDSLVLDEAHMMKNSRATVEFSGGKFLSLADPSARGLDAQAKAWYVRKDAPRKDGVILLSATFITNSPLEIYSMLSLAAGDEKVNDLMMGVRGADDFMEVMCRLENRDEETLDGMLKPYDVFTGLSNVGVLRGAIASICTVKTAEDVGAQIVMPEADELPTPVDLPQEVQDTLQEYKDAFRFALDTVKEKQTVGGSKAAYERVAAKFGEPMELIGHPFNLINKMTMLISDPELDQRASFYVVGPAQADKAEDVVGKWNAKAPVEERKRPGPHTDNAAIVGTKKIRNGEDVVELIRVQARAKLDGGRIVLDSIAPEVQTSFEALADDEGLELDVSVPPKLAAMVANYQKEEANPRGRVAGVASGRVRQLVFCDVLPMHTKIKRLIHKRCGVALAAIAIITGSINGKPEQILDVQDGFNAEGDDNKFRSIIANEKAEVGINLQKGTQAIHHLTVGWTPDSLTQRNGRGVRQGNETQRCNVYHYDANGTFDVYKRTLVGKKASWIDAVLDDQGGDTVDVSAGLSREQLEALIDSVGDADAMTRIQAKADAAEKAARANSTQGKQAVNLQTIKAQRDFLKKYSSAKAWAADKLAAYVTVLGQVSLTQDRISNPKATASALVKNQNLLAELAARRDGLKRLLDESITVRMKEGYHSGAPLRASSIEEFIGVVNQRAERGVKPADKVAQVLTSGHYQFEVEVSEAGTIGNEWRSEVDMAKAMIEASRRDFVALAGQEGGHPADVLGKVDNDEATVIDGKVLCAGAFVDRDGELGVVTKGAAGAYVTVFINPETHKTRRIGAADAARGAKVALPGSPGYNDMVTRAARIEDVLADVGLALSADAAELLYSATVPEVAQRRTKVLLARFTATGWNGCRLPSPHFPVVVPADAAEAARVVRLIAAQQAAVVKGTELVGSTLYFTCDTSVAVVKGVSGQTPDWNAVKEFAKAAGVKITADDFELLAANSYGESAYTSLLNDGRTGFSAAVLTGATTVEQLQERLRAWLAAEAYPQYDLDTDTKFADPAEFLRVALPSQSMAYARAVAQLHRAAEAASRTTEAGDQAVAPAVAPITAEPEQSDDPERIVGLTGDTRRWKDQIKGSAAMVTARAIWDGNAGCWNVPFKAYTRLIQNYPAAAQGLNVVESSGKLNYGRRRG